LAPNFRISSLFFFSSNLHSAAPPFSSQLIHWGEWISVPLVIAVGFWLIVIITFALNMAFTFVESLCLLKTCNTDVIAAVVGWLVAMSRRWRVSPLLLLPKKLVVNVIATLVRMGDLCHQTNFD